MEKEQKQPEQKNKKSAGNNQWTNTHRTSLDDNRERRDGPGGN